MAITGCGNGDLMGGSLTGMSPGSPSAPSSPGAPSSPTAPGSPSAPATGNRAPSINGIPPSTGKVNQTYDFTPSAFDPDGDSVRFEISGRPSWASFNANTGRLFGIPPAGTSGTFGGVTITVTDGIAKTSLPPFDIVVLEPAAASSGRAVLNWTRPTQYTDGKALTDLAGYRIYYGTSPYSPTEMREITDPAATSTSIEPLPAGTWSFSITSFNRAGVESQRTAPVSLTIG